MTQNQISHSFDGQFSPIQKTNGLSLGEDNKYEQMPVSGLHVEVIMQMSGGRAERPWPCLSLKGIHAQARAHPSPWPR